MKRYAFWILLVLFFMPLIIYQAYIKRGYFAVGGEWLIPILVWVVVVLIRDMYQFMKEEMRGDEEIGTR